MKNRNVMTKKRDAEYRDVDYRDTEYKCAENARAENKCTKHEETDRRGGSPGKYLRILRELVRLRMQQLMVFRLDFFAPFFVDGSLFTVQLLVFDAIYGNVERIGTWDRGAMMVYIGSFSLLNAVSMSLCFFGIVGIPGKIRSGELDLYLTKPVSPLFRLSFEQINPGSLPLVGMSLCIIGYGIWTGGLRPGGGQVAAYLLWMLLMAVLYYDMEVLMRSLSFYVLSTSRMEQLEEASLELCMKLPGTALYGVYKLLFYCLLPYGLMATVPVQSLIGELSWAGGLWAFGIVAGFSLLTVAAWRCGIRRYESASS